MLAMRWACRLVFDVVVSGFVNNAPFLSLSVLLLLVLGAVFAAVQVSTPFIYTLF